MRLAATFIVLFILSGAALMPAGAHASTIRPTTTHAPAFNQTTQSVPQHDDSRVGVQLVVAGIAAGVVVGVGTGAYLLRRKLGRTAYSPDQAAGGGHH